MADSVDRVFVHALNTVKKIPKTGASRPPPQDRLRLYGLYKQAMEGDVDGVMEQPGPTPALTAEELQREQDKWRAWNTQKGLGRTEAKRRYVEALIETMRRYATTSDATELVAELEFVWNQIRHNSSGSSDDFSPRATRLQQSSSSGPIKVLTPMSEQGQAEMRSHGRVDLDGDGSWQRSMDRAVTHLSAEVAALREQIALGREWKSKKQRSLSAWLRWAAWKAAKHLVADCVALALVLLWLRRRRDTRFEDLVRAALNLGREYARKILPSR
ncbi:Acyl CoA binding family protein [Ophiocordyceps camponoti-floridani]|uniref:Acyl CoA binding family protein n=1 Tax=Ophiocordyceps camponoti-floridani TaxID=2030778 RepID=A0A8H4VB30_9HYPO|nr:Acyl CoA binding family protein [Ophiocordyceps camponoti-floridani]